MNFSHFHFICMRSHYSCRDISFCATQRRRLRRIQCELIFGIEVDNLIIYFFAGSFVKFYWKTAQNSPFTPPPPPHSQYSLTTTWMYCRRKKQWKMARCQIIMTTIHKMGIISPFMFEQCIHRHITQTHNFFLTTFIFLIVQNSAKQTLDSRNLLFVCVSLSLSLALSFHNFRL